MNMLRLINRLEPRKDLTGNRLIDPAFYIHVGFYSHFN